MRLSIVNNNHILAKKIKNKHHKTKKTKQKSIKTKKYKNIIILRFLPQLHFYKENSYYLIINKKSSSLIISTPIFSAFSFLLGPILSPATT